MTTAILGPDGRPITRQRRRVRARYDAAQTTPENRRHWAHADALSADAANTPQVRRTLQQRSRYEFANSSRLNGMLATLANDTIGTGPYLNVFLGDKKLNAAVEDAFWKWSLAADLAHKLRVLRIAKARDGAGWAAFVTNRALKHPVKLDWRLYEDEQIADPAWLPEFAGTDGIILDDFGNPLAYKLLREHPGGTTLGALDPPEIVPARLMVHYFHAQRAGQHRGIPEITPALGLFGQIRRYTQAVILNAEAVAAFTFFLKSTYAPNEEPEVQSEAFDEIEYTRGLLTTLPDGTDIAQAKAEQPATTYEMFMRSIVSEAARCLNMPFNIAAGDSASYNYSSARLDHKLYSKAIRVERSHLESDALLPTLREWWSEARSIPGYLPDEVRGLREPPGHEWRWDGEEHIDPQKEAGAQSVRLASGTTHRKREYAAMGLDLDTEDEAAAESYNVTVEEYRRALFAKQIGDLPAVTGVTQKSEQDGDEAPSVAGSGDVQATALNGAQITALLEIAQLLAAKGLPTEGTRALIEAAFPLMDRKLIDTIVNDLSRFTPVEPEDEDDDEEEDDAEE